MDEAQKTIRDDLSKGKMIFSEESSRSLYEMGNMELVDRIETNLGDYSVSFLPEARTKGIEHVSNAASGFDPIKVRWTESEQHLQRLKSSILPCLGTHFQRKEKWSQPWQQDHQKSQKRSTETRQNTPLFWPDGRTTKYTERLNWYTVWTDEWVQVPRLHLQD